MKSPKRIGANRAVEEESPILTALKKHEVSAEVTDLDHFRIHGGMAVETDYIVTVKPVTATENNNNKNNNNKNNSESGLFDAFTVSKSYSAFRAFAASLKKTADSYTSTNATDSTTTTTTTTTKMMSGGQQSQPEKLPEPAVRAAKYCELVSHLIESQRTQYLGKVNYMFVKVLAKQRCQIIDDVLEATCTYFPEDPSVHPLLGEIATIVETFFLTDHCEAVVPAPDESLQNKHRKKLGSTSGDGPMNPLAWIGLKDSSTKSDLTVEVRSGAEYGGGDDNNNVFGGLLPSAPRRPPRSSVVVPRSTKARKTDEMRELEERELDQTGDEAGFMLEESALAGGGGGRTAADSQPGSNRKSRQQHARFSMVPNYSRPTPIVRSGGSKLGDLVETNPVAFVVIAAVAVYLIYRASLNTVRMDGDVALLAIFAAFCFGLHMPRPMMGGYDVPPTMKAVVREDIAGRRLLRRSIMASTPRGGGIGMSIKKRMSIRDLGGGADLGDELLDEDEMMAEEPAILRSPLPVFPPGAKIGSHSNCWSEPDPGDFYVRGPNYLEDKKKVASGEFIFPIRGVDLFLTDTLPENVGSNSSVFGGNLRDKPTFIINFRLPWGVLLFYFEIPEKFLPFIEACYDEGYDRSKLPSIDDMTAGDRTAARFLLNDMAHKNGTLKIVPYVVDGPWVVKQVVGGKPAIIGNKLPVNYVYQPEEKGKALYIEADLDIAGSSAARGILSVARSYTNILTLDLGFVVQGNAEDELPECMLVGCRIHGVDPLTAPSLPPSKDLFMTVDTNTDDGDETSVSPGESVRQIVVTRE